jgi:hypothetical protein
VIGYVITGGIVAFVILCLVAFARFIAWKDGRDMVKADHEIHWVHQGIFDTPYNSVKW